MRTTTTPINGPLTNEQVADLIGLTHSAVSRLRSGSRQPSMKTMFTVEAAFDWPAADQIQVIALSKTAWSEKFESVLNEFSTTAR